MGDWRREATRGAPCYGGIDATSQQWTSSFIFLPIFVIGSLEPLLGVHDGLAALMLQEKLGEREREIAKVGSRREEEGERL